MSAATHQRFDRLAPAHHDARTGRRVWNLTPFDDAHCVCPYFYLQPMSADERYLAFASDRDGRWELYRLDLTTGETLKLFDRRGEPGLDYDDLWNTFVPGTNRLMVFDNGTYREMEIESLACRTVLQSPDPSRMRLHTPGTRLDDGRMASTFRDPVTGHYGIAVTEGGDGLCREAFRWTHPERTLTHLLSVPGRSSEVTVVPVPDRQNHKDPSDPLRARCWKVNLDTGESWPFLTMPVGRRATHEYWEPTRGRLFFHRKTVRTWTPTEIASIDRDGGRYREHYASTTRQLGHSFVSPDGRWLVTDIQEPHHNELILIDLESGDSQVICWPDSSMADQPIGHVHPLFSPSGGTILFTTDTSGKAGIYAVAVDWDTDTDTDTDTATDKEADADAEADPAKAPLAEAGKGVQRDA